MNLRYWAPISVSIVALAACSNDITSLPSTTHVRLINAVYNLNTITAPGNAIDVLIDSSTAAPGAAGIALNTVRDYAAIPTGVHNFVARTSGVTPPGESLFTTTGGQPFLPKQDLTAVANYTILAVGINPATGPPDADAVMPVVITDDPFPPAKVNGAYQGRLKIINAAPYASGPDGSGAYVDLYITPGNTPLSDITDSTSVISADYRSASDYVNLDAGDYVLTFATNGVILQSLPVTLVAGEVRTYVLLNTGPVTDPDSSPGPDNHTVLALTDAKF